MATASPPRTPWLFGPLPDLLLGCGLLYLGLFALFALAGDWWVARTPGWLAPLCVLLFSLPHYGATLVRVYEHASDRRSYAFFSVWTTAVLVAAFAAGLYSVAVGSFLLTLYLSWSPWHYTGQNYGLAVMFLRRRGVAVQGAAKRWLHASFVSSYALTLCVIHESSTWGHIRSLPETGPSLHFVPLGLPGADWLVPALATVWLATTAVAVEWGWRRAGSGSLPVALLMATQSLWFAVPAVGLHWGWFQGVAPLGAGSLAAFLVWIAVGHAVQYLWVTAYFAKAREDWRGPVPWLARTFAAGALVWTLPVLLLAARPFGAPSYETGVAFLVASVVNLHHFVLDGAIWKLRSGRIARVLIASAAAEPERSQGKSPLRAGVWAVAGVCLAAALFVFVEESWLLPRALASRDPARATAVLDRLAWVGRDTSRARSEVGGWLAQERRYDEALVQYQRSVWLRPDAETWGRIALMHASRGERDESRRAQERALALQPDNAALLEWAARLSESIGDPERAAALRERGARIQASAAPAPGSARKAALY